MDAEISFFKHARFMKKSQITIFIIIGLIFVVALAILFLLIKKPDIKILDDKTPQPFIESCTQEAVEDAIAILSKQGGDIAPKGYLSYNSENIVYLCYTSEYYEPCINQRPLLIEHIQNEITAYITPRVQDCFFELEGSLSSRYDVESTPLVITTLLQPKTIVITVDKKFNMAREEEVMNFDHFKITLAHPLYNLAEIAMEITNQESLYCNFDELGYMILYPSYDIESFITGESNIVYKVTERSSEQAFAFAARSCPLPSGY
ncbi:MAG: hypothetical protein RL557_464 [archaeon]|jgi:hypothetical protein